MAKAEAISITLGLETPKTTEGVANTCTLSGMPARRAASTTLSDPIFVPTFTYTVLIELAVALYNDTGPKLLFP